MTDLPQTVAEARAEYRRVRAEKGRGSGYTRDAFDNLCRVAHASGQPLDALRAHSRVESERFFAQTVAGPDGHVYWTGAKDFRRNDGMTRAPLRWWWEHLHGPIGSTALRVRTTCDDPACINPEHAECKPFQRRWYTDAQLLGALQVMAMRLGKTPSQDEWTAQGGKPTKTVFGDRFGSWNKAIRAAGLVPIMETTRAVNRDLILASIRYVRDTLGRRPLFDEFRSPEMRAQLHARGLPTSHALVRKHFGRWADALKEAEKE